MLGAVIAARRPHTDVFEVFRPGLDFDGEVRRKAAAGLGWGFDESDLYDDALPTLATLRGRGYRLAVMANQPIEADAFLATLAVDRFATSAGWGVAKPDPAFFTRICAELGCRAEDVAYVGDRVDNDVLPAKAAGMVAVHVRRGPWGVLHADWPEAATADVRLADLTSLPAALGDLGFTPTG